MKHFSYVLVSLLLASGIYLSSRSGLRMHEWASAIAPIPRLSATTEIPNWIRFNLPDGLWQFAFCVAVFRVWRDAKPSLEKTLMLLLPLLLGIGIELGQAFSLLEGIFDAKDLVFEVAFGLLAAFFVFGRPTKPLPRSPSQSPPIPPSTTLASRRDPFAPSRAR